LNALLDAPELETALDLLGASFDRFGYVITFVGSLLENTVLLGMFLPGAAFLLLASAYARGGLLLWPAVMGLGWAGMVLGNAFNFWLGRTAFLPLASRFDILHFNENAAKARGLLNRRGLWAIVVSHLFGPMRCFVAITAGTAGFSFGRFLLFEAFAALVWNIVYCSLGYFAAAHLDTVRLVFQRLGLAAFALIAAALLSLGLLRLLRRTSSEAAR